MRPPGQPAMMPPPARPTRREQGASAQRRIEHAQPMKKYGVKE
jgi:hypothetical protein